MSQSLNIQSEAAHLAQTAGDLLLQAERLAHAMTFGDHGRRKAGLGDHFWQYRPFQNGLDSPRSIDHRRSAKQDQDFVRQLEWKTPQVLHLWVDSAASMRFSSKGQSHKHHRGAVLALALAIAAEKAGIIKPGVPVVVGENNDEVVKVLIDKATDVGAPWVLAKACHTLPTDLLGAYQKANVDGVMTVISQLKDFEISQLQLEEGLRNVVKNTGLQGRWQVLAQKPLTIADVAHNGSGIEAVMRQLTTLPKKKLHIVFGMVADKDFSTIASFLPTTAVYYFCSPKVVRAKVVSQLVEEASLYGLNGEAYVSVEHALISAQQNADIDDIIFVGGSVFTVAEVL